ncbi:hypothetical protein ACTTAI_09985 [Rhodobacter capsulatus]|uniref:hypothetical protein n=1 Tax=Rhodobacter capsulatus TaxID=1061 RepID=UPI00402709A7
MTFFIFASADAADRITDFRAGSDDIDLTAFAGLDSFADLSSHMTQSGRAVVIEVDGFRLTLDNVTLGTLSGSDFLL